jgi:hypothetical protein
MKRKIKTKKYFIIKSPLQTKDLKFTGETKSLYSVDGKIVLTASSNEIFVISDNAFLYMSDNFNDIKKIYDL